MRSLTQWLNTEFNWASTCCWKRFTPEFVWQFAGYQHCSCTLLQTFVFSFHLSISFWSIGSTRLMVDSFLFVKFFYVFIHKLGLLSVRTSVCVSNHFTVILIQVFASDFFFKNSTCRNQDASSLFMQKY